MKLFSKIFSRLLFIFIVLIVVLTLALNAYLRFSGIKEQMTQQAEEALGKPVRVEGLYFLPWSGLCVRSITMTDPTRPASLQISTLSLSLPGIFAILKNSEQWQAEVRIKKIFFNDHLLFKKISAEAVMTKDTFSINPLSAKFLGGRIQGTVIVQKNSEAPYQGSFTFLNIPLQEALAGTALQQKVSAGKIQGNIDFAGVAVKPSSFHASGAVELLGGELKTADFFGTLSRLFPMEELQVLKLREAKAKYSLSRDAVRISSARLQSDNMIFSAYGNISMQGEVALESSLILKGKLANCFKTVLPSQLAAVVSQVGYCEIPFKIYGSLTNLQSNFSEKMFTQQIPNNVEGILKGLLNGALR